MYIVCNFRDIFHNEISYYKDIPINAILYKTKTINPIFKLLRDLIKETDYMFIYLEILDPVCFIHRSQSKDLSLARLAARSLARTYYKFRANRTVARERVSVAPRVCPLIPLLLLSYSPLFLFLSNAKLPLVFKYSQHFPLISRSPANS